MSWFPDVFWLISEWVILLAISVLVGVAIGWFVWRRNTREPESGAVLAERAQLREAAMSSKSSPIIDLISSSKTDEEMAILRAERDDLVEQRNRLRDQLRTIESVVGDAESDQGISR